MEKIWLQSYSQGVPAEIDPDQYSSLPAMLDEFCQCYANQHAFVNFGTALTYRELDQYSEQFAAYLQKELRLSPGDRVAIMMPNILQYPVVLLATLRAGLIVVNVNPFYTAPELKRELLDSGAKAIIVLANFVHALEEIRKEVFVQHVIVTQIGDLLSPCRGMLLNITQKLLRKASWRIQFRSLNWL